ncbi:GGDEF domain-containing protein [Sphingomonas morindae]|uniref:diguanylate cyclase n=1 Tax=Sphingomonas morindae TaxID=1541170 RepID=A0ABY4XAY5_9SPHN|nr:GGDEF domain-containing protein [Sphingomonas morindae]USI74132.1 GGDEF domain-containing protein [Sphingomonas morindae]
MTRKRAKTRDGWLVALLDWSTGLPGAEVRMLRADIFETVLLRPLPLLFSGVGLVLISGAAAMLTRTRWALLWCLFDLVMVLARFLVSLRLGRGQSLAEGLARCVVVASVPTFLLFGLGCTASFLIGPAALQMVVTAAMMSLIAGLASRWAALPRLAIATMLAAAAPFGAAVLYVHGAIGALFTVAATTTAALTLQNHSTLVAMLRGSHQARRLSRTDSLTGLANRSGLAAEVARLEAEAAPEQSVAALFVDLDGFKAVNDAYGHAAGDAVLVEVAARLAEEAAPHFVCRLGGDEFVILLLDMGAIEATRTSERLVRRIEQPLIDIAPGPIQVGASIGIATGSIADGALARLLDEADAALYRVKRTGGNGHARFGPAGTPTV